MGASGGLSSLSARWSARSPQIGGSRAAIPTRRKPRTSAARLRRTDGRTDGLDRPTNESTNQRTGSGRPTAAAEAPIVKPRAPSRRTAVRWTSGRSLRNRHRRRGVQKQRGPLHAGKDVNNAVAAATTERPEEETPGKREKKKQTRQPPPHEQDQRRASAEPKLAKGVSAATGRDSAEPRQYCYYLPLKGAPLYSARRLLRFLAPAPLSTGALPWLPSPGHRAKRPRTPAEK